MGRLTATLVVLIVVASIALVGLHFDRTVHRNVAVGINTVDLAFTLAAGFLSVALGLRLRKAAQAQHEAVRSEFQGPS